MVETYQITEDGGGLYFSVVLYRNGELSESVGGHDGVPAWIMSDNGGSSGSVLRPFKSDSAHGSNPAAPRSGTLSAYSYFIAHLLVWPQRDPDSSDCQSGF